jgi:hypothetical protein
LGTIDGGTKLGRVEGIAVVYELGIVLTGAVPGLIVGKLLRKVDDASIGVMAGDGDELED